MTLGHGNRGRKLAAVDFGFGNAARRRSYSALLEQRDTEAEGCAACVTLRSRSTARRPILSTFSVGCGCARPRLRPTPIAGNAMMMLLDGAHWSMPVTENPVIDTVEIWNLINLTDDAHPIHLHLVRFQILDRRHFEPWTYQTRTSSSFWPPEPPAPNEAGWKDTVRADGKMVTRIIVPFEGYTGRYVWHCHLLEHEDNEMMRPYEVLARAPAENGKG